MRQPYVAALGSMTIPSQPPKRLLGPRRRETNEAFGERAIATALLNAWDFKAVTWPVPRAVVPDPIRDRVSACAAYANTLPNRVNCRHNTFHGAVTIAHLVTFGDGGHYGRRSQDCMEGTCNGGTCHGKAWVDCNACARRNFLPEDNPRCIDCGNADLDGVSMLAVVEAGVVVFAPLCNGAHAAPRGGPDH